MGVGGDFASMESWRLSLELDRPSNGVLFVVNVFMAREVWGWLKEGRREDGEDSQVMVDQGSVARGMMYFPSLFLFRESGGSRGRGWSK